MRRTGLLAAAALICLAGCSGGSGGGAAQRPASAEQPGEPTASSTPAGLSGPYVALGDSYTSGLRIPPQVGTVPGCGRSGADYPSLVAGRLHVTSFTDVSCSGATTTDLASPQRTGDGTNPPQLDALSADTGLVTVGIGGNDAGFLAVVGRCAVENVRHTLAGAGASTGGGGGGQAPCRSYYTDGAGRGEVGRKVDTAGERLGAAVAEIRRRAPQARVYVVGYPALLPADPASCAATLGAGMAPGDVAFLSEQEQRLNSVLRQRAEAAGAVFVDTYSGSRGHDMCAGAATRWLEPPQPAAGLAALHPNERGAAAMAEAVLAAVAH
ncbi:SGNH/GDSL hydrolase family protein [Kitasatospora paracochleata]|uniref:Lysophospholipase L1-like esterase n=1 Tax=Kitasatospora paracochleata TaxID=58354 RepID=A0ABT1J132_9ACTN|nr:SGNH/GDSL hydrolase family protein [Kitasatospora paracochleata]MCP2310481.1 lysophospholipase L1-like esterase [Kitasatospora paracochleata]